MNVNSESDIYDDPDNVLCLFCNSLIFYTNSFEEEEICEHTVFIATQEAGFEFIRNDYRVL
jgi:hypothetical protein